MIGKVSILLLTLIPLFHAATWTIDSNFKIDYQVQGSAVNFVFTLSNSKTGWMGMCFNEFMYPADCIVCQYNNNKGECFDSFNPGIKNVPYYPAPIVDTYQSSTTPALSVTGTFGKDNLKSVVGTKVNNQIVISVTRDLDTRDKYDQLIMCGNTYKMNAAYHDSTLWNTNAGSAQTKHSQKTKTTIKFCFGARTFLGLLGVALMALFF